MFCKEWYYSLNPCFSGTYSLRVSTILQVILFRQSLNPCFSGTYSLSECLFIVFVSKQVLILVLVEHTL